MELLKIGQAVAVKNPSRDLFGKVVGYGIDCVTGDLPRPVYLIELNDGGYLGDTKSFVRMIVVHPDNISITN